MRKKRPRAKLRSEPNGDQRHWPGANKISVNSHHLLSGRDSHFVLVSFVVSVEGREFFCR